MENLSEKTEEASAKRLKAARECGDVPFSEDLYKISFLLVSFLLLWCFAQHFQQNFYDLFCFDHLNDSPLEGMKKVFFPFLFPLTGILLFFFFLPFLLSFLQRGFLFVTQKRNEKLPPQSSHKGVKVAFFLLNCLILVGAFLIFFTTARLHLSTLFYFILFTLLALLVSGICDFFVQRLLWKKRMRMTKAEIEEERRENVVGGKRR